METSPPVSPEPSARFDPRRRFVRLRRWRDDGFVEFDFALGSPDLHVELILPRAGFDALRRQPGTEVIDESTFAQVEAAEQAYLYGGDNESTPAQGHAFPAFLHPEQPGDTHP